MRIVTPDEKNGIYLGRQGESLVTEVHFDVNVAVWEEAYGMGTWKLLNRRPSDPAGYPVEITVENDIIKWIPTATDLKYAGCGTCELIYTVENAIAKSIIYGTQILPAIDGTGEIPEPWESWVDEVVQARDDAQAAAVSAAGSAVDAAESAVGAAGSAVDAAAAAVEAAELADQIEHSLDDIEVLIPPQASPENQLADKTFVNSSVATNTANYISNNGQPFTSVEQLEAYSGTVTNNDYAFVTGTDAAGNTYYDRYKATVSGGVVTWAKEYRLNNSSFTAVQWAAIESGITGSLVASYSTHIANKSNPHEVTAAQVGLGNVDNTSDLDKPISTATQAALDGKISKVAGAVANDLAVLTADGNLADSGISADYLVPVKAASGTVIEFNSDAAVPLKSALIKGKTAAINQLVKNGDFADTSEWSKNSSATMVASGGVLTLNMANGTSTNRIYQPIAVVSGHAYLIRAILRADEAIDAGLRLSAGNTLSGNNISVTTNKAEFAFIVTGDAETNIVIGAKTNYGSRLNLYIANVNCIDLTAIGFTSSETADVATLKAAWLAKYGTPIPQYIPYSAGSIVNNNATYQLCGHNIWDEQWELGTISATTGENVSGSSNIRTKNYISVKPNTTYFYCNGSAAGANLRFYDANKQYIGAPSSAQSANGTFTTPDNACYLRFACLSGYGTTYKDDIAINFPATVTTYEPYHDGGSITADDLNGIGTVADEQDATGHIDRRISEDDFSDLSFTTRYTGSVNKTVSANLTDQYIGYPATEFLALAEKYDIQEMVGGAANLSDPDNKAVGVYWYGKSGATVDRVVYIVLPVADTPTGKIVYRKATPTTDTTTPATLTTQKGYNLLRTVSGDIQSVPAEIEHYNGLAAVVIEAVQ